MHIQNSENDTWDSRDYGNAFDKSILTFVNSYRMSVGESIFSTFEQAYAFFGEDDEHDSLMSYFYTSYKNYCELQHYDDFRNDAGSTCEVAFVASFVGGYSYFPNIIVLCNVPGYLNITKFIDYTLSLPGASPNSINSDGNVFSSLVGSITSSLAEDPISFGESIVSNYCIDVKGYCTSATLDSYLENHGEEVAEELFNLFGIDSYWDAFNYFPHGDSYVNTTYIGTSNWGANSSNETDYVGPSDNVKKLFNATEAYVDIYGEDAYSPESSETYYQSLTRAGFFIGSFLYNTMDGYAPSDILVSTLDLTKHYIHFPNINLTLGPNNVTRFTENNRYVNFFLSCTGHSLVDCYTFNDSDDKDTLFNYFNTEPNENGTGNGYADIPFTVK
jgi:hypothetical protein